MCLLYARWPAKGKVLVWWAGGFTGDMEHSESNEFFFVVSDIPKVKFRTYERALQPLRSISRVFLLSQRKAPMALSLKSFLFRLLLVCSLCLEG